MSKTTTVLIDCDGTLTDGKVVYMHDGHRTKSFHSRDIRAIKQLIAFGIDVIIVTQSSWNGADDYVKRTGAILVKTQDKSVKAVMDQVGILESYIMVGDDAPDIELMRDDRCQQAYCPLDADPSVHEHCHQLSTKGGEGVIAELVRILSTPK
jgi:3-deoxy-D-manno-octulosonate 8-phosphate phosphatase (KDO 8-P phosphatase)